MSTPSQEEEHTASHEEAPSQEAKTIYVPEFFAPFLNDPTLCTKEAAENLKERNWLPQELVDEIESCFPTGEEIDHSKDEERCPVAYQAAMEKFFPSGRVFANYKQLDQCQALLLGKWAVNSSFHSKAIRCFCGKKTYSRKLHPDPAKRRKVNRPQVNDCPFILNFSYVGYSVKKGLDNLYFPVKLTTIRHNHNHPLNRSGSKEGKRNASRRPISLKSQMNKLVTFIRTHPNSSPASLRPFLDRDLSSFATGDTQLITDLRNQILKHLIQQGLREMTAREAKDVSTTIESVDELILYDNPIYCANNLTALLRNTMNSRSDVWEAILFLDNLKTLDKGIDYQIMKNEETEKPEGVCWSHSSLQRDLVLTHGEHPEIFRTIMLSELAL